MRKPLREQDFYNDPAVNPHFSDLRELIHSSVERFANQPMFLDKEEQSDVYSPVLFREMLEHMNGLGTALLDLDLKGKKIVVIGENSYLWFLTYMAVVNGVGIIVPLDKDLTSEEIAQMTVRADAAAIIHSDKAEKKVIKAMNDSGHKALRICMKPAAHTDECLSLRQLITEGKAKVAAGDRRYMDMELDREGLCTLLFTSGTTGVAKGVMLSHKNITSNVVQTAKYVNVHNYVGLCVLPMHHCYAMSDQLLVGISQGNCVAINSSLRHILDNMKEAKVNVMLGVPLIFEFMYKQIWKQAEKKGKAEKMKKGMKIAKTLMKFGIDVRRKLFNEVHESLGGEVKMFISGAAGIAPHIIEDFNTLGFNMIQGYGMTECAPIISLNPDFRSKPASVGPALPDTKIKLVDIDEDGIGEVIAQSPSVMIGYYEDPEETAKVLKDGWLYTGDYGYLDKEGYLYLTGRKKNVIITKNGKNVFPEEVELHLNQSDYIAESLVWGMDDPKTNDTVLCAEIFPNFAYIKETHGDISEEETHALIKKVIDEVNDKMTTYKWVRRFTLRDTEFEKTTTQKIKRFVEEEKRKERKH